MKPANPVIYCIKCPDTFRTEEDAKAHFRKVWHGFTYIRKNGFEGQREEEEKRRKDGRRRKKRVPS